MAGQDTARSAEQAVEIRRTIEMGLECYRRGDLRGAIAQWQQVLTRDPQNVEAQNLITYARDMLPPPTAPNPWPLDEKTEPETAEQTRQRVLQAESTSESDSPVATGTGQRARRSRMTVESPISAFLAPITSPDWVAPKDLQEEAPDRPVQDEPSAVRPSLIKKIASGISPVFSDTLRDDPAKMGRLRATEMVERCGVELANGQVDAAVAAAEGAFRELDRLPSGGIPEVIDAAGPLFEQVFVAHLGPPHKVAVSLTPPDGAEILEITPHAPAVLAAIDGVSSLGQILANPPVARLQCLRTLSALLRAAHIKVM